MRKNFLLLPVLLVMISCTIPQNEEVKIIEKQKEGTETSKYSVSFSVGEQQNRNSRSVPAEYDEISYFIITLMDSNGKKVINRKRYDKINWAPGYVVSEPLELETGSYTLEELILLDYNDNVLYATPRTGSDLEDVVTAALPVPFNVVNQDNIVYTQVVDTNSWIAFQNDPIYYFGYDLGILDEVETYRMYFRIKDIDANYSTEDLTITYDGNQLTKTINASGTYLYVPKFSGSFTVEVNADNGSSYYKSFYNSEIDDGIFSQAIQLSEEVDVKFIVMDDNGDNIEVQLWHQYAGSTGYTMCDFEDNIYSNVFLADNSTKFYISEPGFEYFTYTYTLAELKESYNEPIVIQLEPVVVTFPVLLENAGDFPDTNANIIINSNGITTVFNDIDLDTTTSLTFTRAANPVSIIIQEPGVYYELLETTISELDTLNSNNEPLTFTLSDYPVIQEDDFESGFGNWSHDYDSDYSWARIYYATSTYNTGPDAAYEGDYYVYVESNNRYNSTAGLISPDINFDLMDGEYITMKIHMYGSTMGSLSIYYQNDGSSEWNLVGTKSGNQGNNWLDFTESLDHITGIARIKISATIGSSYYSDIAIDNVVIGF